jgi:hypothetical protein
MEASFRFRRGAGFEDRIAGVPESAQYPEKHMTVVERER